MYVAYLLGNTIFARKTCNKVNTHELRTLYLALGKYIGDKGEYGKDVSNKMFFLYSMFRLRERTMKSKKLRKSPVLCFGGMHTPFFIHMGIYLTQFTNFETALKIDTTYLNQIRSASEIDKDGDFIHTLKENDSHSKRCSLPLYDRVKLNSIENIQFKFTDLPYNRAWRRRGKYRQLDKNEVGLDDSVIRK